MGQILPHRSVSDIRSLLLSSDSTRCIQDSYQYIGPLGAGAFGSVFKARNLQTGEMRAVKHIPFSGVQGDMAYVHRELEAMIRLNHPNIVKLYEFVEDGDSLYVVQELCDGGDFWDLNDSINDPAQVRLLFKDLMMAVAYCHDLGIAHRDLKLSNCLVQKLPGLRRVAKVIDFGLAAIRRPGDAADSDHWLTEKLGSEYFVAPEVISGRGHYGVKCDCWSVGVMLYIVFTGEHPFTEHMDGLKRGEVFQLVARAAVRTESLDGIDAVDLSAARDLVLKLLQKSPEERPDSQAVLRHAWFMPAAQRSWHSYSGNDLASWGGWVNGNEEEKAAPLTGVLLSRIRAFIGYTHFERALLTLAGHYATSKDVEDLRSAFERLDASKSGSLSREELEDGLRDGGHFLRGEEVDEIFHTLDADRTGKVHYTKWLASTIKPSLLSSEKMMDQVYQYFDPKQEGRAVKTELCVLLGVDATVEEIPSKTEFKALLSQMAKNMEVQCIDSYMNLESQRDEYDANRCEGSIDESVRTCMGLYGGL